MQLPPGPCAVKSHTTHKYTLHTNRTLYSGQVRNAANGAQVPAGVLWNRHATAPGALVLVIGHTMPRRVALVAVLAGVARAQISMDGGATCAAMKPFCIDPSADYNFEFSSRNDQETAWQTSNGARFIQSFMLEAADAQHPAPS